MSVFLLRGAELLPQSALGLKSYCQSLVSEVLADVHADRGRSSLASRNERGRLGLGFRGGRTPPCFNSHSCLWLFRCGRCACSSIPKKWGGGSHSECSLVQSLTSGR